MARKKRKNSENLSNRISHLENELLRELGDIGDMARQFIALKKCVHIEINTLKKEIKILKKQLDTIRRTK